MMNIESFENIETYINHLNKNNICIDFKDFCINLFLIENKSFDFSSVKELYNIYDIENCNKIFSIEHTLLIDYNIIKSNDIISIYKFFKENKLVKDKDFIITNKPYQKNKIIFKLTKKSFNNILKKYNLTYRYNIFIQYIKNYRNYYNFYLSNIYKNEFILNRTIHSYKFKLNNYKTFLYNLKEKILLSNLKFDIIQSYNRSLNDIIENLYSLENSLSLINNKTDNIPNKLNIIDKIYNNIVNEINKFNSNIHF